MQLSIRPTEFAQTAVIAVVTIAALALLGLVGGYWTWQWLAPRPEPRGQVQAEPGGQIAAALELFGSVQKDSSGNAPAPTGIAIRLLGVVAAAEGREGYAIVVLDGRQIVATREGQEIAPGIGLAEVAADHVVLERNGVRETLAWPEKTSPAEPSTQRGNR